ncbi:MAG: DUF368 domain-containing protein [Acholeplasmatales bacterium]|nr:DUF368 domain-containing protein [Acholeplasmatales bacterium]
MLKHLFLVLKGILFGASNLIPGASGGTTLVVCGIYEETLDSITNLKSNFKKSIIFLLFLLLGTIIGVIGGSLLIKKLLANIPFITYCIFAGFIIGGIPALIKPHLKSLINPNKEKGIKKIKWQYILAAILAAAAVLGLLFLGFNINTRNIFFGAELQFKDYALLFLCGFIGIFAMIVPGVSGILIFLILGYYRIFLDAINNIFVIECFWDAVLVGLPVGLGMIAGLIPASLLMKFLLKKFPTGTYYAIFGFVLGSIACLFISYAYSTYPNPSSKDIIIGIIELIVFTVISYVLSTFSNKKKEETQPEEIDEDALRKEILEELKQENIINDNNELIALKQEDKPVEEDDSFVVEEVLKCPYCNSKNFIEFEESMYLCNNCKAKFESKK